MASRFNASQAANKRGGLASSAGLLTALQLGRRVIELGFTAVLARLLTPADFGVVAAATIFILFAQLLVEVGIGATVVQLKDLTEEDVRAASTIVLINSMIYFLITQACAPLFGNFMGNGQIAPVLHVLAFVFLFQAVGIVPESLLVRRLEAPRIAAVQLIVRVGANGLVGVPLALSGWGYWSLVAATLSQTLLIALWLLWLAKPPMMPLLTRPLAKRLMRRGTGFSVSRLLNFAALRGDNTLVGHFMNETALGLYSRAYNLMSLPADLYGSIAERLVFPSLAAMQDDPQRLRQAYLRGTMLTALIGLPLSVLLYILGPEIVLFVLGGRWTGVIAPFTVLSTVTYFRLGMKISGSTQRAKGAIRMMILTQALYAALVVGGCIVSYPFGLLWLSGAVSLGVAIVYTVMTWTSLSLVGIGLLPFLRVHRPGLGFMLAAAVAVWPLVWWCRRAAAGPFVTLSAAGAALCAMGALLMLIEPRWLVGQDGVDLIKNIRGKIPLRRAN